MTKFVAQIKKMWKIVKNQLFLAIYKNIYLDQCLENRGPSPLALLALEDGPNRRRLNFLSLLEFFLAEDHF